MIELSRLSCWSVVASSLPPPPAPEHTEEELSTASPSASSTSLSIRSLHKSRVGLWFLKTHKAHLNLYALTTHLRYTRIAAVLFLSKAVLLDKVVEALRLFPHVVKCHTFCYRSRSNLGENANRREHDMAWYLLTMASSA